MIEYRFTLPKPPSINNYYTTNSYTHQRVIKKEGKEWLEEAGYKIGQGKIAHTENIALDIRLFVCGRFDWDNGNKPIGDLLTQQGYIKDDNQIVEAHVYKYQVPHRKDQRLMFVLTIL